MAPRPEALLRYDQMKLREQILRLQAAVLIDHDRPTGHQMQELLDLIEKDAEENADKLSKYHDTLRRVQRKPVVNDEGRDH